MSLTLRAAVAATLVLLALSAGADEPPEFRETIDLAFDRPEAWGMKYFSAAILPIDLVTSGEGEAWSFRDVTLELGWLPHLDEEQRTIGFNGIKEEDLNKLPVLPRPALSAYLPYRTTLTVGWIPPLELEGVEANLLSLATRTRFFSQGPWAFDARLIGQTGTIESDFTCPATAADQPPGSPGNIWACESTSHDRYSIDQGAAEAIVTRTVRTLGSPTLQGSLAAVWIDAEFQVDAVRSGFRDLTLLKADGTFWTASVGAVWNAYDRFDVGVAATWAPIDVKRPNRSTETDPFYNIRVMVSRKF